MEKAEIYDRNWLSEIESDVISGTEHGHKEGCFIDYCSISKSYSKGDLTRRLYKHDFW